MYNNKIDTYSLCVCGCVFYPFHSYLKKNIHVFQWNCCTHWTTYSIIDIPVCYKKVIDTWYGNRQTTNQKWTELMNSQKFYFFLFSNELKARIKEVLHISCCSSICGFLCHFKIEISSFFFSLPTALHFAGLTFPLLTTKWHV